VKKGSENTKTHPPFFKLLILIIVKSTLINEKMGKNAICEKSAKR
jgi:hypothetical protein